MKRLSLCAAKSAVLPMPACVMALLMALPLWSGVADARGFRGFTPIASPDDANAVSAEGVRAVPANTQPVSREAGAKAVSQLVDAWNQGNLSEVLSENFYDKSQLLDAIATDVPKDASLRLVSVRSVQTLSQRVEDDPQFGQVLVSQISATARTQVEFNDPDTGSLVNRPGENEFILEVRQRMPQ